MGPTASGKTDIAVALQERFPIDIISVDSALVYRGMDIGTAKPDAATLARAPHALVDILEPEERYSAGDFVRDARRLISESHSAGRLPLLVGGTMMYFRALTEGLAALPNADPALRSALDAEAEQVGWPALHAQLAEVDPVIAERLHPEDSQRIQRALEVYRLSGKPLSDWQACDAASKPIQRFLKIGLTVEPRALLHERIELRLKTMINNNFEKEVKKLMTRKLLTAEHPSMRSVGYRQFWAYLSGDYDRDTAEQRTLFATRQLAKRQLTWMRSTASLQFVDALHPARVSAVADLIAGANPA